jgi:bifunctional lysine-specific demethylase and histidyl-hydroxylase MINA
MTPDRARAILAAALAPLPLPDFFAALGRTRLEAKGSATHPRAQLLGADPRQTLLDAFGILGSRLGCHAVAATSPPPAIEPVGDPPAFLRLIQSFHERDYTVTFEDVAMLSPPLQHFIRALVALLHQPVSATVFWSKPGARAIVHYDNRDNIVIQLSGQKRWFISTDPPSLPNNWKRVGEAPPSIEPHEVVDASPGDLLYIPRGTPHTVHSTTESLHLAILFTPLTLRDAMIAAIDHLSDLDRGFRETLLMHVEDPARATLPEKMAEGAEQLLARCQSPEFVASAVAHRSARMIADLPALPMPAVRRSLTPRSRVTHAPLAIGHLMRLGPLVDFSQPGARMAIHAGAEPALHYILETPSFRIGEIPGLADDVRIALVERLLASGFLEHADFDA